MKFLCDRCKTRYSIGDDRVRGKILKIRCKNCANVITVREGMLFEGPAGWAEWSPFLDYDDATCVSWLRAAREAAEVGWPAIHRHRVDTRWCAAAPQLGLEVA